MEKAKEIFWTIIGFIFWIPWVAITFVFLPFMGFALAKSMGDSGFYGAIEIVKEYAKFIYYKFFKTDMPEDEA